MAGYLQHTWDRCHGKAEGSRQRAVKAKKVGAVAVGGESGSTCHLQVFVGRLTKKRVCKTSRDYESEKFMGKEEGAGAAGESILATIRACLVSG
jgi:hypothetical protein